MRCEAEKSIFSASTGDIFVVYKYRIEIAGWSLVSNCHSNVSTWVAIIPPPPLPVLCIVLARPQTNENASSISRLSTMKVEHLEPHLRDKIREAEGPGIQKVYFNKGLWNFSNFSTKFNERINIRIEMSLSMIWIQRWSDLKRLWYIKYTVTIFFGYGGFHHTVQDFVLQSLSVIWAGCFSVSYQRYGY